MASGVAATRPTTAPASELLIADEQLYLEAFHLLLSGKGPEDVVVLALTDGNGELAIPPRVLGRLRGAGVTFMTAGEVLDPATKLPDDFADRCTIFDVNVVERRPDGDVVLVLSRIRGPLAGGGFTVVAHRSAGGSWTLTPTGERWVS